ncbi:hypothetical protein C0J52_02838 [Blattella germanica]|nr:hypothetical protein C0J52_02838 [Blattella germanica]
MAVNMFIILFALIFLSSSIESFCYPQPSISLDSNKCKSRECYRAAARLMQTMDRRVDPCVNFYNYVCGNYEEHHPIPDITIYWDNYMEKNQDILKKVRDLLEEKISEVEPTVVSKAKVLYKSCMDTDNFEELQLTPVYHILQKIGLPVRPKFNYFKGNETMEDDNWISTIVRAKRVMNMDLLVGFYMGPADRNNSVYRLIEDEADLKDEDEVELSLDELQKLTEVNGIPQTVEDIIKNVESAFSSMIHSAKWMDRKSKEASLEKVRAVKYFIAFPDWILNKTALEEHYSQISVTGSNFLLDMSAILEGKIRQQLEQLGKKYEPDEFPSDPLDINAFYYANMNSLELPAGILQYPFLDLGLQSLNYGSMGALIGHELNHGFEQFAYSVILSNSVIAFISYVTTLLLFPVSSKFVNGNRTLAENLADFSGLHASFLAFQTLQIKTGVERKLPGFEDFTPEQLFFLSYGNFWCQAWTAKYVELMANDEHAPNYFRILGSLHNSEEFSKVWNCPKGSPMNPKREKCKIW